MKSFTKKVSLLAVASLLALGLNSTSAQGAGVVIGMSSPSLADAGQQVIAAGVKTWVDKQGWTLIAKNANGVAKDQATAKTHALKPDAAKTDKKAVVDAPQTSAKTGSASPTVAPKS